MFIRWNLHDTEKGMDRQEPSKEFIDVDVAVHEFTDMSSPPWQLAMKSGAAKMKPLVE
jgi:hypothetical protein